MVDAQYLIKFCQEKPQLNDIILCCLWLFRGLKIQYPLLIKYDQMIYQSKEITCFQFSKNDSIKVSQIAITIMKHVPKNPGNATKRIHGPLRKMNTKKSKTCCSILNKFQMHC